MHELRPDDIADIVRSADVCHARHCEALMAT